MIIVLTGHDGQSVFINSQHIMQFRQLNSFTELMLTGGKIVGVSESASQIMKTINENRN
ncbi:flagellar FlbD family protein [Enterobacter kobei]